MEPISRTEELIAPAGSASSAGACRGVASLTTVQSHLDELYSPEDVAGRNALSRTDGYWPFIQQGEEPPTSLTYGEFDVPSLAHLLEEAQELSSLHCHGSDVVSCSSWDDKVFTDIGSGTGRMVLAAAALYPSLRLCRGIELLPGIHDTAVTIARKRDQQLELFSSSSSKGTLVEAAAPVQLLCGSFVDVPFHDSDIIFCFSTCMEVASLVIIALVHPKAQVVTQAFAHFVAVVTLELQAGALIRKDSIPK